MTPDRAEGVALALLQAIASEPDRMSRFVALTGLPPYSMREAAADPGFFIGVLDYVMSDDGILVACAAAIGEQPEVIAQAHHALMPDFEPCA